MNELIIAAEANELRRDIVPALAAVQQIEIIDANDAQIAFNLRAEFKAHEKKVCEFFKPLKASAALTHKSICAAESKELAPALDAIGIIDGKLSAWQEKDRLRLAEELRQAEAAMRQLAESQALATATALEATGDHAEAAAVLAEPIEVPAVQTKAAKIAGGSFRTEYYGTGSDLLTTAKAAAGGDQAALTMLCYDTSAMKKFAMATKGAVKIPGVTFGSRQTPVGR